MEEIQATLGRETKKISKIKETIDKLCTTEINDTGIKEALSSCKDLLAFESQESKNLIKAIQSDPGENSFLQYFLELLRERIQLSLSICNILKDSDHDDGIRQVRGYIEQLEHNIVVTIYRLRRIVEVFDSYNGTFPLSDEGVRLRRLDYEKCQEKTPVIAPIYCSNQELLDITERMILFSLGKNYSEEISLILVDDCSPLKLEVQKIVDRARHEFNMEITLVRNQKNLGYARSVQRGVDITNSHFFIMANNDIYVPRDSINNMLRMIKADPRIGAIGPVSSSGTNKSQFSELGPSKLGKYSPEACSILEETAREVRDRWKDQYYDIRFLCGWFVIFNREAFDRTGGFNPLLLHSFNEDSDISWGLQKCGYKLVVDRSSYIFHGYEKEHGVIGPSMSSVSFKSLNNWARNAFHFAKKFGILELNSLNYNYNWRKSFDPYHPPVRTDSP